MYLPNPSSTNRMRHKSVYKKGILHFTGPLDLSFYVSLFVGYLMPKPSLLKNSNGPIKH